MTGRDEDGIEAREILAQKLLSPPEDPERAAAVWHEAFSRLGSTEFRSEGIRFEDIEASFVPVSGLNRLRRTLIASLQKARSENRPSLPAGKEYPSWPYPQRELTFEAGVLNSLAEKFYRKHGVKTIEQAPESGQPMTGRRIARSRACPLKDLGLCGSGTRFFIQDDKGRKLELKPDCSRCEVSVFLPSKGAS